MNANNHSLTNVKITHFSLLVLSLPVANWVGAGIFITLAYATRPDSLRYGAITSTIFILISMR